MNFKKKQLGVGKSFDNLVLMSNCGEGNCWVQIYILTSWNFWKAFYDQRSSLNRYDVQRTTLHHTKEILNTAVGSWTIVQRQFHVHNEISLHCRRLFRVLFPRFCNKRSQTKMLLVQCRKSEKDDDR